MSLVRDGWDDDEDIIDDGDEGGGWNGDIGDLNLNGAVNTDAKKDLKIDECKVEDGWDDDNLDFNEQEDDEQAGSVRRNSADDAREGFSAVVSAPPPLTMQNPATGRLYRDIEAYILSLEQLSGSINALLDAEHNNPDKASELCSYYSDRPGLVEYTIEKELPRMDYALQDGPRIVTDKQEIARHLRHHRSLIPRCANQSILADLLQVFTGRDLLVRPQFLATAFADACHFYLDLTNGLVQVQSRLTLSLPSQRGRWEVAEILVSLTFVPSQLFVEYRLDKVDLKSTPETDPMWQQHLESVVDLVSSIHPEDAAATVEMADMNFRDVFLQESQNLLQNSAEGMHSAWKDFEQVAGLRNKLKILPSFLPDHVVHAASEEPAPPPQARPSSILGGLVRSGISRLAKQVALPEEDPTLYEGWVQQKHQDEEVRQQRQHQQQQQAQRRQQHVEQERSRLDATDSLPNRRLSAPVQGRAAAAPSSLPEAPAATFALVKCAPELLQREEEAPAQCARHNVELVPKTRGSIESPDDVLEDGWGEEDELDILGEEEVTASPPRVSHFLVDEQRVPDLWTYDPATDIIPSRKRWTNPHPGRRLLKSLR